MLHVSEFQACRTTSLFKADGLIRVGLFAIGRDFEADLCFGGMYFYQDDVAGH